MARFPWLFAFVLLLGGCSKRSPAPVSGPAGNVPINVQLDWVAEPEHGGFYAAEAAGYFKEEHLDVHLIQGGANIYVMQKVGTDQAQLGQADSTNSLVAIQSGVPVINVASLFQHDPSVLMMQQACPVTSWKDLDGRSIMARPEWAFLPFLRAKYHLNFKVIPQNFDNGRLAHDPDFIQMGYYIAEPFRLEQQGVKLKYLLPWNTGFDAYTTLIANRDFARDHPAELKAFLRALRRGYATYFNGDPGPAHALMRQLNARAEPAYLDWSRKQIISAHLDRLPDGNFLDISAERYRQQIAQLEELAILKPGSVHVTQAMDGSFLR